jgi:hypothetical protein
LIFQQNILNKDFIKNEFQTDFYKNGTIQKNYRKKFMANVEIKSVRNTPQKSYGGWCIWTDTDMGS